MLIKLTFKTPDVVDNAINMANFDEQAKEDYEKLDRDYRISLDGEAWIEERSNDLKTSTQEKLNKLIEYGEYLSVYYNTLTGQLQLKGD